MRIAVIGSGGLGGYFGARLAQGGADVRFLARGSHLAAMREHGLAIEGGPEVIRVVPVRASDDPADLGVADFVLLAVKLWDTETVLEQIKPVVGPGTTLISFQNGVLKDEALRTAYGPAQIMGGVGYVATALDRPGVIRQTGPMQRLVFGEFDGRRS
jgi:2-dehydropantoate 2-reductase